MAELYDVLRIGRKALDYHASKLAKVEQSNEGIEFLREDIQKLSLLVSVAKSALADTKLDDREMSKRVKDNKDILCHAIDQYVGEMEKVKSDYWKQMGVRPELLEKEIAVARQVKADVCS